MIPEFCRVKTDTEAGTYGDCVRACVASIMELPYDKIDHFFHDGNAENGRNRMRECLAKYGYAPVFIGLDGTETVEEILQSMLEINKDCHYILWGSTQSEDHAVVCYNGKIVHDPAWIGSSIIGPLKSSGIYVITVIAKK